RVLFETDHSRMIEIDCGTGTADDACGAASGRRYPGGHPDALLTAARPPARAPLLAAAGRDPRRGRHRSGRGPRHRRSRGRGRAGGDACAAFAAGDRGAGLRDDLGCPEPGTDRDASRLRTVPRPAAAASAARDRGMDRVLRAGDEPVALPPAASCPHLCFVPLVIGLTVITPILATYVSGSSRRAWITGGLAAAWALGVAAMPFLTEGLLDEPIVPLQLGALTYFLPYIGYYV